MLLQPESGLGLEIASLAQIPGPLGQPSAGLCSEVRDKGAKGETKVACPLPSSKYHCWWDTGAPVTQLSPN
jgi:hypothetical protein